MPRRSRVDELAPALHGGGGQASAPELISASSPATLRAAVRAGLIARTGYGVYALRDVADAAAGPPVASRSWSRWEEGPTEPEARALVARHALARGRDGALSHASAAAQHGWPLLGELTCIDLAVPYGRKVPAGAIQEPIRWHHRSLTAGERRDHVTTPLRTVIDCARDLPLPEAVAVADAALRSGQVGPSELVAAGQAYRGRAAARVRHVAARADSRAANPFESALRATLWDVPELSLTPQYEVQGDGFFARVDLADVELRIAVEADSYEFHGSPERFAADRRRYAELTARDWLVLPFGFGAVMREPGWVCAMARAAVLVRHRQRSPGR